MASLFQQALAANSAAQDAVYGEPWIYIPMAAAAPNDVASADNTRAVMPITASFFDLYARASSGPARKQGVRPERPGHASSRPILDLDITQLPYAIAHGDRVKCNDKDSPNYNSVWEIAEPRPDGTGRAELDLNLLTPGSG
jgi:hypothetical protein